MVAGTTSSTTFKIRCDITSGTLVVNGVGANLAYGAASSTKFSITEYQV